MKLRPRHRWLLLREAALRAGWREFVDGTWSRPATPEEAVKYGPGRAHERDLAAVVRRDKLRISQ